MNRDQVKQIAITLVRRIGLINLSRRELCKAAGIADGSFMSIMDCTFTEFIDELRAENINQCLVAVNKRRVAPSLRKEQLLKVAVAEAIDKGYNSVTRDAVAEIAGVSFGLITKYFGTMTQLKNDIIRYAIKNEVLEIVAQGIANQDHRVKKIPAELRKKAIDSLSNSGNG